MTTTDNYNLNKPDPTDLYSAEDYNENFDIIDENLGIMAQSVNTLETDVSGVTTTADEINTKVGETANTGGSSTAGSIFAKLNKIISDLSSHISAYTSTRASKLDNLNASISSRAPSNTALSNATWTNARATAIDTINTNANTAKSNTTTNNTASKTGILSQKLSYIISLLENTTYGLSALKNAITSSSSGGVNTSIKGKTVYTGTPYTNTEYKYQSNCDSIDNPIVYPIAEFIAPVSGMYRLSISLTLDPGTRFNSLLKISNFVSYDNLRVGYSYESGGYPYRTGHKVYGAPDVNKYIYTGSNGIEYIGRLNNTSVVLNFFCTGGEPVTLAVSTSNVSTSKTWDGMLIRTVRVEY